VARAGAVAAALGALVLVRVVWLGADPPLFKTLGNMVDEGLWLHNARSLVLDRGLFPDDLASGPTTAPLFHWVATAAFLLAGPGLVPARAVSAAAAIAAACILWSVLRAHYGRGAAALGVGGFALNDVVFAYSRLGLPEMLQLTCLAASLAWELGERRRAVRSAAAGAAFGAAVLAKISAGYFAPAYVVWWAWLAWRAGTATAFVRRAVPFAAGALGVALALLVGPGVDIDYLRLTHEAVNRRVLVHDAASVARAALTFLTNPFWGVPSIALLVATAAAWAASAAGAAGLRARLRAASPATVLATVWLIVPATVIGLTVRLQEEHRFLLFALPLAMLAAAAIDALGHGAPAAPGRVPPAAPRAVSPLLVGVVAAWLVVAVVAALVWTTPWRPVAARVPAPAAVVALLALAAAAAGTARRWPVSRVALATAAAAGVMVPVAAAVVLVVGRAVAPLAGVVAAVVGLAVFAAWARAWRTGARTHARAAVALVVCGYVVAAGTPVGLTLLRPRFSLPEGSRTLAAAAPPAAVVTGPYAETLALDTSLRPLHLLPHHESKSRLNRSAPREAIEAFLERRPPSGPFLRRDELAGPFRERATIPLFPDPLHGEPRIVVSVWIRAR